MGTKLKISYHRAVIYLMALFTVVGCFGYIGSIYIYRTTVKYMAIVLLYSIFVLYMYRRKSKKIPLIWFVLWIYIIISTLFLNFPNSIRYLIVFTLGILLIKLCCIAEDFFTNMIKFFSIAGCFFSFGTFIQAFAPSIFNIVLRIIQSDYLYEQTQNYWVRFNAYCGFAGESSFNAFCISLGILCLISQAFAERKLGIFRLILILISYYAIFLTGKRSFLLLIPMIIFFVFLFFAIAEKRKKYIIIFIILLILTPLVFYSFLGDIVLNILASGKGSESTSFIDLSNREVFWGIAIGMLKSKPLFGHGLMSYDNFYNSYFNNTHTFAGAHNSYFQLLGEMGIVGGLLFFTAIIKSFLIGIIDMWKIIGHRQTEIKIRMISFYSICIQAMCILYGFSGNTFHRPQQLFTYFVAIAMGLYVHKRIGLR